MCPGRFSYSFAWRADVARAFVCRFPAFVAGGSGIGQIFARKLRINVDFQFLWKIVFWLNGRTTCSCRSVSSPRRPICSTVRHHRVILLCALAADVICRFVILAVGRRIIVRTKKRWGELLFNRDVLRKFSNIVPVALIYILIPLAFPEHSETPCCSGKSVCCTLFSWSSCSSTCC